MAAMRAADEPSPPQGDQKKFVDQLTALVPTEAVALYVAAIGAAAAAEEWVRWVIFGLVLILTPAWVVVSYWEKKGGRTGFPGFEVVVGTLAFVAWTTTVPRGTFDDLGISVWVGTIVVAVASAVLTLAARFNAVWARHPQPRSPAG
jgi:hypothetical protein